MNLWSSEKKILNKLLLGSLGKHNLSKTWKPYILYDTKTVECTHYIMVDREACIKSCFMTIMTVGETNLRLPGLSKINFLDKKTKNLFVARMVPELWL